MIYNTGVLCKLLCRILNCKGLHVTDKRGRSLGTFPHSITDIHYGQLISQSFPCSSQPNRGENIQFSLLFFCMRRPKKVPFSEYHSKINTFLHFFSTHVVSAKISFHFLFAIGYLVLDVIRYWC